MNNAQRTTAALHDTHFTFGCKCPVVRNFASKPGMLLLLLNILINSSRNLSTAVNCFSWLGHTDASYQIKQPTTTK